MEVLPHAHPLKLIYLNPGPEYPHNEVVYDDEEELIMKQDFRCPCGRCGQEINFYHRYFYTCSQCDYSLHKLCAELSTTLRHESHHDHALILCRVSDDKWYCATISKEASYSAIQLNSGTSAASKNYKDSDYPELLHLPSPDQTAAFKHFYGESGSIRAPFETNLTHPFHQHPLTLVDTTTSPTSSRITTSSSHDSMKMVEVLCDACVRPITNMSFYKCTDDGCNFVLHLWCTRLPTEVKMNTLRKGIRTLKLLPPVPFAILGVFRCLCCELLLVFNRNQQPRTRSGTDRLLEDTQQQQQ
ncbi:hypothetical protein CTI12_AA453490 [Artemisia annua]|uniref:DC1 domain-containing protein n=1 Tax=Artemisia annua TaxID=35608 RepID=A0A2U1LUC5_ARTAN|nr:hypothetical protein CTI12_AA453490 [Artemisia annua]